MDEITFKWTLVRMLGKCKKECAELVWKTKPKSVPEAVALIRDWEHRNGHPAKVWVRKFEGHTDRRRDWQQPKAVESEVTPTANECTPVIKTEKPWFQHKPSGGDGTTYSQAGQNRGGFRCFKCGKTGHIKRNCPKMAMKKVENNNSGEEIEDSELMIQGCVNGQEVPCEVDTGAQMCVIPERLTCGLQVFDRRACCPIGSEYMAAMVKVCAKVGPVDTTVTATVVPDQYCTHPLVGRNVGLDNLMECLAIAKAKLDGKMVVQTREQERQQQAADLQGEDVRQAEQLDVCELEDAENLVMELDEPGVAVVEAEETVDPAVALDTVLDLEDAEATVMSDTSVDGSVNLGLEIPLIKRGSSLNQEYSHSVMLDETLKEWRQWAESKKHGFCGRVWKMS